MTNSCYAWRRYWVPREGNLVFDHDGYLITPDSNDSPYLAKASEVESTESLLRKQCLVLLGEPGMGKSYSIKHALELTSRGQNPPGTLFLNLGAYSSDSLLVEKLTESPQFLKWQSDRGPLHVFLDSFDEALLRVDSVAALLAEQFLRLGSVENLFIRIASRTAEWSTFLEEKFKEKWGKSNVGIYELAPLSRQQISEAVESGGGSSTDFHEQLQANGLIPLAIKPLTLELLVRLWRSSGHHLPKTQLQLYQEGCLALCDNPEHRQTPILRGSLSAEERLELASVIAASLLLCNRSAVWTGPEASKETESDISLSTLRNSPGLTKASSRPNTNSALKEALNTGLFSSRGAGRLSWAHHTFGEFLAARCLVRSEIRPRQIFDLILHPGDEPRSTIPQLREVTAWMASEVSEIYDYLMHVEPEVLLKSDVGSIEAGKRESLVDAILGRFGKGQIVGDVWTLRKRYCQLRHARIEDQILRWLTPGTPLGAKVEAVVMGGRFLTDHLARRLVEIACSSDNPLDLRIEAARSIRQFGNEKWKRKLRPLALESNLADDAHRLRAVALKACWPKHITAMELFESLQPADEGFYGEYHSFLHSDIVKNLKPSDLKIALNWVRDLSVDIDVDSEFGFLSLRVLEHTLDQLEKGSILKALAGALFARLRAWHFYATSQGHNLQEQLASNKCLRLRIVSAMVPSFTNPAEDAYLLSGRGLNLICYEDVEWLLKRILRTKKPSLRLSYSYLLKGIFRPNTVELNEKVIEAAESCAEVANTLSEWLGAVSLTSQEAKTARAWSKRSTELQGEASRAPRTSSLQTLSAHEIDAYLSRFEAGDLDAWWTLLRHLQVGGDESTTDRSLELDLRKLPGWKRKSDEATFRFITAAKRYLTKFDLEVEKWFSRSNVLWNPALAGVRSLVLLAGEAPQMFQALSKEVWIKWLPALMRIPCSDSIEELRHLVSKAFQIVPKEANEWVKRTIELENGEGDYLHCLSRLPSNWSPDFSALVLTLLKRGKLKTSAWCDLLSVALRKEVPNSIAVAISSIPSRLPEEEDRNKLCLHCCREVMVHGQVGDWGRVKRLISRSPEFGRRLMEGFGFDYAHSPGPILKTLTAADVGWLWEWMVRQYPSEEDRDRTRGGEVTDRDSMADLRNGLLIYLRDWGTPEACAEIASLAARHPSFPWLSRLLVQARERYRAITWLPPSPEEFYLLLTNARARFVQSGAQLLEVIEDSLDGLQTSLTGEIDETQFLWNKDRPKEEEAISDWITKHLTEDLKGRGVVVSREVRIRRVERTDIHISAVVTDRRSTGVNIVKVIVEVKGCWNPELSTAMKTQLLDRYLATGEACHGLYIAAWFCREAWSRSDHRRSKVRYDTREELERDLQHQATELSKGSHVIRARVLNCSLAPPRKKKIKSEAQRQKR